MSESNPNQAPKTVPLVDPTSSGIPLPKGFRWGGFRCGLKNKRKDVGIILSERPAVAAAAFTQNQSRAACVVISARAVANGELQAIVVNSGNANCCTGLQGERDAESMVRLTANALQISEDLVAVASTGVIGQLLDMSKVEKGIAGAVNGLTDSPVDFVEAILTTDLVEKEARAEVTAADGTKSTVYGCIKGSGMISPNMATLLAFVTTDADVSAFALKPLLDRVIGTTLNCLTVDSDTSTNDMAFLLANGASGSRPEEDAFERAVHSVLDSLTRQVARDGEGATKLVEVVAFGSAEPAKIARAIADSPLVKTAMFGCDPNWGRMMMAAGKAGVPFHPDQVTLAVECSGELHTLFEQGQPSPFDPKRVSSALKSDFVRILITVQPEGGPVPVESLASAHVYTCDFGYGYVRINAEYHT